MTISSNEIELDDALATVIAYIPDRNDEQARAAKVLAVEVLKRRGERLQDRYPAEEVLSLLIVIDGISNYPREFTERIPRLFEAADAVRASREPPL